MEKGETIEAFPLLGVIKDEKARIRRQTSSVGQRRSNRGEEMKKAGEEEEGGPTSGRSGSVNDGGFHLFKKIPEWYASILELRITRVVI